MILMDASVLTAWAGVAVAFLAALAAFLMLIPTKRAADAAVAQTALQREIAQEAAAPRVWADVRPFFDGAAAKLVVGNSGPTVATEVVVSIDPPLPVRDDMKSPDIDEVHISALVPGRELQFFLFASTDWDKLMPDGGAKHRFTITTSGPFGTVTPVEFTIDLGEFRTITVTSDVGSLHEVTKAIKALDKTVGHQPVKISAVVQDEVPVQVTREIRKPTRRRTRAQS